MSTPAPSKHALALYRFLETEWSAMQIAPTTWCRRVGIPDPTVYRWKTGVEPDMKSIRRVAEALERPVLDVLVAAGYVSSEEAGGHVPAARQYSITEAMELDTAISEEMRAALRAVYEAVHAVESGAARSATVRSRRGRLSTTRRS